MKRTISSHSNPFNEALEKLKKNRWQYTPPDTPHEKFYAMVKKNDKLMKLKETFDLEVKP